MKILSLSGFIPEQICDIVRFNGYSGNRGIAHYCGYASDYISQVINDESIDGAVFPRSCDSCRVIGSYLSDCGKFLYQMNVPARRDSAAVQYLALCIKHYKSSVEKYYGIAISDIEERSEIINKRNVEIKNLYERLGEISYTSYLRSIHKLLSEPLHEQSVLQISREGETTGKRVYLVGSFLSGCDILESIEKAGMTIVGDNLTESKRLFSVSPVELEGNIYENIAKSILQNKLSPTQNNFLDILAADLAEIKRKQVRGVIYISQKYCEPYDYLFFVYKKMLDNNNIPVLHLSLADSADSRKSEFSIEAFADMI